MFTKVDTKNSIQVVYVYCTHIQTFVWTTIIYSSHVAYRNSY